MGTAWRSTDQEVGVRIAPGALGKTPAHALTRLLIAEGLERMAEAAYRDGRDPPTPSEEQDLSEGVFDRLWGCRGMIGTAIEPHASLFENSERHPIQTS